MCLWVWGFESLRGHHYRMFIRKKFVIKMQLQYQCPRGGIGRRAWFRSMCLWVWGFESLRGHHYRISKQNAVIFEKRLRRFSLPVPFESFLTCQLIGLCSDHDVSLPCSHRPRAGSIYFPINCRTCALVPMAQQSRRQTRMLANTAWSRLGTRRRSVSR
jgi:hypothetical protein